MNLTAIFTQELPAEKQAEGIAVATCNIAGACLKCRYLPRCKTDETFVFPVDASCSRLKKSILEQWSEEGRI